MNLKKLMNIMFSTAIVAVAFTFSACGTSDPDDPSNGNNSGNGSGNTGGGETTESYYIKHPWSTGTDDAWSWQQMTFKGNGKYFYAGYWGGVGANINTSPDDSGADWFAASSISGASSLSKGTLVTFNYDSNTKSLSVEGSSSGGGGGSGNTSAYYIKHPWSGGSWTWQPMSQSGSYYTYTGVWGGTGANINTSASDSGADWFPESNISGASSVSVGTTVTFTYSPSSKSLSLTSNGGGNQGGGGGSTSLNAPTGLNATVSGSVIQLRWNAVSGATGYNVYRSKSANDSYTLQASTSDTYWVDNYAISGNIYYYKVSAYNNSGESAQSAAVSAQRTGGGSSTTYAPAPPKVTKVTFTGNQSITITWSYTVTSGTYSSPTQVKLSTERITTDYTYYVFDWTTASSKKSHKIEVGDIIGENNSILNDQTLHLEAKNSAGEASTQIMWGPSKRSVWVKSTIQDQWFEN